MKTLTSKGLTKKIDKLWAKIIKIRANHECEYCGRKDTLNSHHVFGRRKMSTRWSFDNGVCLCAGHHVFSTEFSAHQTPLTFDKWIIEKRGKEWYDNLILLSNTHLKLTKFEKEDILRTFEEIIKQYENNKI